MSQETPGQWHWIERRGFNATSVRFVTPNELVACGSIRLRVKDVRYPSDDRTAGVVLYSPDLGKTWTSVYQDEDVEEFQSITVTDKGWIFVAGGDAIVSTTLESVRNSVGNVELNR